MNLITGTLLAAISWSGVQEADDSRKEAAVTVRGQIAQFTDAKLQITFDELNIHLMEQVELPDPPFPQDWGQLTSAQRQTWWKDFIDSSEGKALAAEHQKLIDSATKFELKPDPDGKFVIYDVPPGRYGIRGRADKVIGECKYAFEVFGQVDVGDKIDELMLDPIMILPTPLLSAGESCPAIDVASFDKSTSYKNDVFQGKFLFLNFWSAASQPSTSFQPTIQKMYDEIKSRHEFQLLSICLDEKPDDALALIIKENFGGIQALAGGWDHPTVNEFGVRSIPSYWLIGPDGKILMTNRDFQIALASDKHDLTQIIADRISGKSVPAK